MTRVTSGAITVVLHGAVEPHAAALAATRASLADTLSPRFAREVDFVAAFERPGAPRGAAALVADAIASSRGGLIVSLATNRDGLTADAGALVDAASARSCLAIADASSQLERWVAVAATTDLVGAIATDAERVFAGERGAAWPAFVPAWSAPRDLVLRAGGLDARRLHVGDALDLALRVLEAGAPVERLAIDGPSGSDVYPMPPGVAEFLAWRHAASLALERPGVDAAGRLAAWVTALALARAWHAAKLDPGTLRFGGNWARRAVQDRWLGHAGIRRNDVFWPKNGAGTAIPYMALDAALDEFLSGSHAQPGRPRPAATPANDDLATGARKTIADAVPPSVLARLVDPPLAAPSPAETDTDANARAAPTSPRDRGGELPVVSAIVVNWNGKEHLDPCFSSLGASDYPPDRLELICVDNGSSDGSQELLASRFPQVTVVALEENRGFTGGNVAGVAAARGSVLAFFNNDMRIAPDAIRLLVQSLDAEHPCVAARVLSWDGQRIDFVRGTLSFEARGFQEYYGDPVRTELSAAGESFFANGGAFAIARQAYEAAGGFDEAFFAYYDDTDLGWGVRINGGRIRIVPDAVAYHRHSATTSRWPEGQKLFLMERNAVWAAAKRYGEPTLARTLGPLLLLAARRVAQDVGVAGTTPLARSLAPFSPRLRGRKALRRWSYDTRAAGATSGPARRDDDPGGITGNDAFLVRIPLESVAALGEAIRGMQAVSSQRRSLQAARSVGDELVLPHFGRALNCMSGRKSYRDAHEALVGRFGLETLFRARTRVLLITHDPLRANMSGPGVRVLELGRALAASCDVTVATPFEPEVRDLPCRVAQYSLRDGASMIPLAEWADVVVVQGFTLTRYPILTRIPAQLVVDLYCPFTIEHLEMQTSALRHAPGAPSALSVSEINREAVGILDAQNFQLELGDFFICASERQRDFWLGALQTAGRLNALNYASDPSLRSLIDVVPFGLPDRPPPAKARRAIKGVLPGIAPDDQVIVWAGSLLDWQDPQGLVRAVATLARTHPRAKLVFMGTRHPNPDVPLQRAVEESIAVARDTGVLDRHVFFNTWVPYAERHEWLLDADLGVSTHRDHLETRFAYRTRMLDYLWSALPVVCTRGDVFADLVEQEHLGLTVPAGDEVALAAALARLLDDDALHRSCAENLRAAAQRMRWSRVVDPLRRFCVAPRHAADRAPGKQAVRGRLETKFRISKWMKRTALEVGLSEARIEQIKKVEPVRSAMIWRNKVAIARARRGK